VSVEPAADYDLTKQEAATLGGLTMLPHNLRVDVLTRYAKQHGVDAVVAMFSRTIGMANSVIANNREAIEVFGICEGTLHPHNAHQINLPTLIGAIQGTQLSHRAKNARRMCHGCAYRLGSLANQSFVTTIDADFQRENQDEFWCHENTNQRGKPTKRCRGHQAALKEMAPAKEARRDD
jgi:hypothetical protein